MWADLPPLFEDLLRTNDLPLDMDLSQVEQIRAQATDQLSKIDTDIDRLEMKIAALHEQRKSSQQVVDMCHTILAPIRRVPQDIVSEIFYHCLPTHRNCIMHASEAPVLLTRICSTWRRIALFESPRIWSSLHIPLITGISDRVANMYPEDYVEKQRAKNKEMLRLRCQVIRQWLERSGTCPLFLSVSGVMDNVQPPISEHAVEYAEHIFAVLRPLAPRWKELKLNITANILSKITSLSSELRALPMLESLALSIKESSTFGRPLQGGRNGQNWDILLNSPTLKRLNISDSHITWNYRTFPIAPSRLSNLTHISIKNLRDIQVLAFLSQCGNLVEFRADIGRNAHPVMDDPQYTFEWRSKAVLLPKLRTFCLKDGGFPRVMKDVFNNLLATSLKYFEYHIQQPQLSMDRYKYPGVTCLQFLEGSSSIEALFLEPMCISPQDILWSLMVANEVKQLYLGQDGFIGGHRTPYITDHGLPFGEVYYRTDNLDLNYLCVPPAGKKLPSSFDYVNSVLEGVTLLPKLEYLEAYHISTFTDEDLLALIQSRLNAWKNGKVSALKQVKMSFSRPLQKDIQKEVLEHLKSLGLDECSFKLDLTYLQKPPKVENRLSPRYGLNEEAWSWWFS